VVLIAPKCRSLGPSAHHQPQSLWSVSCCCRRAESTASARTVVRPAPHPDVRIRPNTAQGFTLGVTSRLSNRASDSTRITARVRLEHGARGCPARKRCRSTPAETARQPPTALPSRTAPAASPSCDPLPSMCEETARRELLAAWGSAFAGGAAPAGWAGRRRCWLTENCYHSSQSAARIACTQKADLGDLRGWQRLAGRPAAGWLAAGSRKSHSTAEILISESLNPTESC
jgi:hypothetical protein